MDTPQENPQHETPQNNESSAQNKSWFSRHPIISVLIVLFLIGSVLNIIGYEPDKAPSGNGDQIVSNDSPIVSNDSQPNSENTYGSTTAEMEDIDFSMESYKKNPEAFKKKYIGFGKKTKLTAQLTSIKDGKILRALGIKDAKVFLIFNDYGEKAFGCAMKSLPSINVEVGDLVTIEGKGQVFSGATEDGIMVIPILKDCKIISKN